MKRFFVLTALLLVLISLCSCCAAEGIAVDWENTIFVGDSVTHGLRNAVRNRQQTDKDYMQGVTFLTVDSYSLHAASRKTMSGKYNISVKGKEVSFRDAMKIKQPDRVFILLGLNDYAGRDIENCLDEVRTIIGFVREVSPQTVVIMESLTPVTKYFCTSKGREYQAMWDKYNEALEALCAEEGVLYADVAHALKGEDNYLQKQYSVDGECHLNARGCRVWMDELDEIAAGFMADGLWYPLEITEE